MSNRRQKKSQNKPSNFSMIFSTNIMRDGVNVLKTGSEKAWIEIECCTEEKKLDLYKICA